MQFIRGILSIAIAAIVFLAGCSPNPPDRGRTENPNNDKDPDETTSLYTAFVAQFSSSATAKVTTPSNGKYKVAFGDGTSIDLDSDTNPVVTCTSEAWTPVALSDGTWHVEGNDTGIAYSAEGEKENIILIMYETDTRTLFVRLSSGRVLFFHEDKVVDVGCFRFDKALNPALSADLVCSVSLGTITGELPRRTTSLNLVATFAARGEFRQGSDPVLGSVSRLDYSSEVELTLDNGDGGTPYAVSLSYDFPNEGAIPKITINTGASYSSSYISKTSYRPGSITIEDNDGLFCDVPVETLAVEIKGRGNTTWDHAKKSYKIKLGEEHPLLGMSNNKHFVLLATDGDKTMLRNSLAYRVSELSGMMWSPRWTPVEFYLDGSFRGLYMLMEHVRTGEDRIEMTVAGPKDDIGDALTGGYLFCIDNKHAYRDKSKGETLNPAKEETYGWLQRNKDSGANNLMIYNFDQPEDPTPQQYLWAKSYIASVEDAIYNKSFAEYSEVIDVPSFIQYFFVQEISKNVDGNMRLSTYIAKPRGGKLFFPCVWDFDLSFGNCNYHSVEQSGANSSTSGWYIRNSIWLRQLFRNRDFCNEVQRQWAELYPRLSGVEAEVRQWAELIGEAHERNFAPVSSGGAGWSRSQYATGATGSLAGDVDFMLDYFRDRVEWMNTEITAGRHFIAQ